AASRKTSAAAACASVPATGFSAARPPGGSRPCRRQGHALAISSASSRSAASTSVYPPTISLPSMKSPSFTIGWRPARRPLSPPRVPGAGCRAQPRLMLSEPPPHLGILLTELFHRLEPGAPPAPAAPAPAPGLSKDQLAEVGRLAFEHARAMHVSEGRARLL